MVTIYPLAVKALTLLIPSDMNISKDHISFSHKKPYNQAGSIYLQPIERNVNQRQVRAPHLATFLHMSSCVFYLSHVRLVAKQIFYEQALINSASVTGRVFLSPKEDLRRVGERPTGGLALKIIISALADPQQTSRWLTFTAQSAAFSRAKKRSCRSGDNESPLTCRLFK